MLPHVKYSVLTPSWCSVPIPSNVLRAHPFVCTPCWALRYCHPLYSVSIALRKLVRTPPCCSILFLLCNPSWCSVLTRLGAHPSWYSPFLALRSHPFFCLCSLFLVLRAPFLVLHVLIFLFIPCPPRIGHATYYLVVNGSAPAVVPTVTSHLHCAGTPALPSSRRNLLLPTSKYSNHQPLSHIQR